MFKKSKSPAPELNADEITIPDADPEVVKAIDAVHAAETQVKELEAKLLTLNIALSKAEDQLGAAALLAEEDSDIYGADYEGKVKDVADIEAYQRRVRIALRGAGAKLQAAKAEVHRLGHAGLLKTHTRFANMRTKASERMLAGLLEYAEGYKQLHHVNEKIAYAWPDGIRPYGVMLGAAEIANALAVELFRVLPSKPLEKGPPPLPGAHSSFGLGNSAAIRSFADTLAEANSYLLRKIDEVPLVRLSIDPVPEEHAEPAYADASIKPAEPALPVQTRSAAELQSTMGGKRRLL